MFSGRSGTYRRGTTSNSPVTLERPAEWLGRGCHDEAADSARVPSVGLPCLNSIVRHGAAHRVDSPKY